MDSLLQDLRYALVTMRRAPGFAITAVITLALGISGAATVFPVVHGLLVRDLPYPQGDRLVRLWEEHPGGVSPAGNRWLSNHTYAAWTERGRTLDAIGGYAVADFVVVLAEPARMIGARLSPNILSMLEATPAVGRFFLPADASATAEPVAVLSDALWRERYDADPAAVGRLLTIDGTPHRIVGVARPGLAFPDRGVRFWVPYPLGLEPGQQATTRVFTALGRLRSGVTATQAAAEGTSAARSVRRGVLTEFFFGKGGPVVVHARPLLEDMTQPVRPALSVLAVAAALVLLIACANVASLVLARGVGRERELALRAALGGTRMRLLRLLMTEYVVLAAAAGLLAFLLAWWLVRVMPALAPPGLPRLDEIGFDRTVAGYCAAATLLAVALCGALPALRAASARFDVFREHDAAAESTSSRRMRNALLATEAAFAAVLVVGASLLAHSFARLTRVDPGYSADGVLTAVVGLPPGAGADRTAQFVTTVVLALQAIRSVTAAGASDMTPLMARTAVTEVRLPERVAGGKPNGGRVRVYTVTQGYAEAVGLRLKQGRFFDQRDRGGRRPMIVNQEFVRQYISAEPAVGLVLPGLIGLGPADTVATEIVGVAGNVLKGGNAEPPQPEIYLMDGAAGRAITDEVRLVIRATVDPATLAADVRRIVRTLEPSAVVDPVEPMTTTVAASVARPRFATSIVASFAGLAAALAAVGLYGVLSYSVTRRRRELGVRAALGASRARLMGTILRGGLSWSLAGLALGVLLAGGIAQLMRGLLFGVSPWDPLAVAAGPLVLLAVAIAACVLPALRAASVDPAVTLRGE